MSDNNPIVEMVDIQKKFPGVIALENVSCKIFQNRVHVLMGENGAGKSTLMKILSGIYAPTSGKIIIDGQEYASLNTYDAARHGISTIYQELSIINELRVYENLFVGKMPTKRFLSLPIVNHKKAIETTKHIFTQLKTDIDPLAYAETLSISKKQIVEIAKVLTAHPRILIMDEPTSSLTTSEIKTLFEIILQLKQTGVAIVYISHKLNEVLEIGDDISILRDGIMRRTGRISDFTEHEIVKKMVGHDIKKFYVKASKIENMYKTSPKIRIKHISSSDKKSVRDVSFDVYKGEVLGFYGVVGSGRTELMNCIFGADTISSGEIYIDDIPISIKSPLQAMKNGIAMITENRRETGFFHNLTIEQNITVSKDIKASAFYGMSGLLTKKENVKQACKIIEILSIKCRSAQDYVTTLSGGNQQKVIVGKWINTHPEIFIFDEPTRGVDVGAKLEIYNLIKHLAESSKTIIIISSDLPEILSICHRIAVFNKGSISKFLVDEDIAEQNVMEYIIDAKDKLE